MMSRHTRLVCAVGGVIAVVVLALGSHLSAALIPRNLTVFTASDIANELVGPGIISISNITYTGTTISSGKFSGGTGIIGFESGVILSTGNIATVVGPNNSTSAGTNLPNPSEDLDLTSLYRE